MHYLKSAAFILLLSLFAGSCGQSGESGDLKSKKAKLDKLIAEKSKIDAEIRTLQTEIDKLEGKDGNASKALVAVSPVPVQSFEHYIDLRGRIDAENISYVTARGMGGQVKEVYVKEGQEVKKGQLLLKLDDAIIKQTVSAARQQLQTLKIGRAHV